MPFNIESRLSKLKEMEKARYTVIENDNKRLVVDTRSYQKNS